MKKWDLFFREKLVKIFSEKESIVDIGGGLRALKERGNRYDPDRSWLAPYIGRVDYKILDLTPDFNPDIVGDIHCLPLKDNSTEAIICLAVLEHVENPFAAVSEIHRVLKPSGYCLVYVPFLFYYHAEEGYYGDYWRFTEEGVRVLMKSFSEIEISPVRGAIETWIKLSPIGRLRFLSPLWHFLDRITGKLKSKQVSGYNVFLKK